MNIKQINKNDIIAITILFTIFIVLLILEWGRWGHPFVDSGRELYIPTLVLQGKVLYKDILNLYGPLSYQFNALLYYLFGANITVLYMAGVINTFIILASTYLISRTISSPFTSFICTFTPMCILVFRCKYICTSNYFFPYAYAFIYAFSALLLSLLFFIYYLKKKNIICLYLSSFIIGLSLAAKLDFVFFVLIIMVFLFIDKKITIKEKLINLSLMFLPSIVCWGILFFQGVRVVDIQNIIDFGKNFANSPSVKWFNDKRLGQFPTLDNIKMDIKFFLSYIVYYSIFLGIAGGITFFLEKVKNLYTRIFFLLLFIYPFFLLIDRIAMAMHEKFLLYLDFCWSSYFVLFIVLLHISIEFFINKKSIKSISFESKIFILVTIIGLLATNRTFFLVCIGFVANFSCLLYFMSVIIYFMDFLPEVLKLNNVNTARWKKVIAISFVVMSLCYLSTFYRESPQYAYKLKSIKGTWYVHADIGDVIDDLADYINKNVKKNETILMLPEGPLLSFITKVPTSPKYYSLIPHMIESYGEENVINALSKNKPDYIFVNNLPNMPYKANGFGKTYMVKTYDFVENNYDLIKIYPKKGYKYRDYWPRRWHFNVKVYKLKKQKHNYQIK